MHSKETFLPHRQDRKELLLNVKDAAEHLYGNPKLYEQARMDSMFGLPRDHHLSPYEIDQFRTYALYAGERILASALAKNPTVKDQELGDLLCSLGQYEKSFARTPLHDISHTFAQYAETQGSTNALTPEFLKKTENEKKAMEEEFYALMWWNISTRVPTFIGLMDARHTAAMKHYYHRRVEMLDPGERVEAEAMIEEMFGTVDHTDVTSVLDTYYRIITAELYGARKSDWRNRGLSPKEVRKEEERFRTLITDIMEHKEERTVALAHTIFEQYATDPKILFHTFQEIAAPLLERLKKK